MAEEIIIHQGGKSEKYATLLPQMKGLLSGESDRVANMANFVAALQTTFGFLWFCFYVVRDGKGVCGTAWKERCTLVVDDVNTFPGHIACSSASKSEIVVPMIRDGEVVAVLDIDSKEYATFDHVDAVWLEKLVQTFPW